MTNRAWYLTLETVKDEIKLPDPADDATIIDGLDAVTTVLPHQFFGQADVRTLTAKYADHLLLDLNDLLSVTELATDDGSWTYPTIWSASDYRLMPGEAQTLIPPQPYWKVIKSPRAVNCFPVGASEGVRITGRWGFCEMRRASGAVIAMPAPISPPGLSLTATTLTVSAPVIQTGHTLRIGDEDMFVESAANKTLTVERGINGSTPAIHADGATIEVHTYPGAVRNASMILVEAWLRMRKDAPLGVLGGAEGFMRVAIHNPAVTLLMAFAERPVY